MQKMDMKNRYSGTVVKGLQNGRKFGFPTANIALDAGSEIPDKGIFAVFVEWNSNRYQGMLYVGTRPTIRLSNLSIEIHIFNFDRDIYREHITFTIEKKIREERDFKTIEALIAQINRDRDEALCYFNR